MFIIHGKCSLSIIILSREREIVKTIYIISRSCAQEKRQTVLLVVVARDGHANDHHIYDASPQGDNAVISRSYI